MSTSFSANTDFSHSLLFLQCEHPSARTYFLAGETKQDSTLWTDTLNRASKAKTWNEQGAEPSLGSKKPKQEGSTVVEPVAVPKEVRKESPPPSQKSTLDEEPGDNSLLLDDYADDPPAPAPSAKPKITVPDLATAPPSLSSPLGKVRENSSPLLSPGSDRKAKGSVRGKSSLTNFKAPVPDLKLKELVNISISGWIYKQGFFNKGWKKRWFVLEVSWIFFGSPHPTFFVTECVILLLFIYLFRVFVCTTLTRQRATARPWG